MWENYLKKKTKQTDKSPWDDDINEWVFSITSQLFNKYVIVIQSNIQILQDMLSYCIDISPLRDKEKAGWVIYTNNFIVFKDLYWCICELGALPMSSRGKVTKDT